MSFYATMTGQIQYPDQTHFNKIIAELIQGGWINHEGCFLDEMNCPISESVLEDVASKPDIDFNERIITIPLYHHRNLTRVEFFETGCIGYLIATTTDGYFEGWVTVSNGTDSPQEFNYNLAMWSTEQELEAKPDVEDFENYCLWMSDVEESFHQTQLIHVQTLLNLGDDNG